MHINPFDKFYRWYLPVIDSGKENSNAVVLSTSSRNGRISSRVVLLKHHDSDGFVFFTNYNSLKGSQLSENNMASLLFYWPDTARQIRIEGQVEKTTDTESDSYFNSRKHGHKINAIVSQQSKPIDSLSDYEQKMESATEFYRKSQPERPNYWGGYRLVPDRFEFWEEGRDRFHSRTEFIYDGESWTTRMLQP